MLVINLETNYFDSQNFDS